MDRSFPYSILPTPYQYPFIVVTLSLFAPTPHILSPRAAPPIWKSLATATHQPPPLVSAPCTVCLHLSPFTVTVLLLLCLPLTEPSYLSSPGGFDRCGYLLLLCYPTSPFLSSPLNTCIFLFSFFFQVNFRTKATRQCISIPYQSLSLALTPPPH